MIAFFTGVPVDSGTPPPAYDSGVPPTGQPGYQYPAPPQAGYQYVPGQGQPVYGQQYGQVIVQYPVSIIPDITKNMPM